MNATQALGWALLHFLWQGAAVAVALAGALRATRHHASSTRYLLGVIALAAMLALPVATALHLTIATPGPGEATRIADLSGARHELTGGGASVAEPGGNTTGSPGGSLDRADAPPTSSGSEPASTEETGTLRASSSAAPRLAGIRSLTGSLAARAGELAPGAIPWLLRFWLVGVLLLSCKLLGGWLQAQRLVHEGTRPAPAALEDMLERLRERLGSMRPVRVLESAVVQVPAVIGWLRPVVLVPASALSGLTPAQLELLLAHELAHVRRHDYLVNLLQSVAETLLFYHPAVWWVSRHIRGERELCCDDLALGCGAEASLYARTLLDMEALRVAPQSLALAATGGDLGRRIRRLLVPEPHAETFPRWMAAAFGMAVVLAIAGAVQLSSGVRTVAVAASGEAATPTIVSHPDPKVALEQRWQWATSEARSRKLRSYWIGYTIRPLPYGEGSVFFGRIEGDRITGHGISLGGRMSSFGDFEGFTLPGAVLPTRLGAPDEVAMLFQFEAGGKTLTRVHISSLKLPVDLEDHPLLWLGPGDDASSLALVEQLDRDNPDVEMQADLVAAIGVHPTSKLVVPLLRGRLEGQRPTDVRKEAAEWLARHPDPLALQSLTRAARDDRSAEVRREAAEAVGEMRLPAAADSAIALAHTLRDPEARREAVESLGHVDDPKAVAALEKIAASDRDLDVQREAVETLGEHQDKASRTTLENILRSHPEQDVRREAAETLGQSLPPEEAERVLGDLLASEPSPDVQREIVETLGQALPPEHAVEVLTRIVRKGPSIDAQREAVETLGDLDVTRAHDVLFQTARSHPEPEVRREALETVATHGPTGRALDVLQEAARKDESPDVRRTALESLADMPDGAGIPALIDAARTHPDPEMRREALRILVESPDPRAQKLFEKALNER